MKTHGSLEILHQTSTRFGPFLLALALLLVAGCWPSLCAILVKDTSACFTETPHEKSLGFLPVAGLIRHFHRVARAAGY
jgi:hypothetical protein